MLHMLYTQMIIQAGTMMAGHLMTTSQTTTFKMTSHAEPTVRPSLIGTLQQMPKPEHQLVSHHSVHRCPNMCERMTAGDMENHAQEEHYLGVLVDYEGPPHNTDMLTLSVQLATSFSSAVCCYTYAAAAAATACHLLL